MTELTPAEADGDHPASVRMLCLIALVYAFTVKLALFFPDAKGAVAAV